MNDIDWVRTAEEMDEFIEKRYSVLDALDEKIRMEGKDKISALRRMIIQNYSKTKAIWKNYGTKAAVHAVYDYVMAKTYYRFKNR